MQGQGSLTPQKVAGALKRAGYDASKKHTTGIRGWSDSTEGFRTAIQWPRDGSIVVTWHTGGHHHRPKRQAAMLVTMMEILTKEFDVEILPESACLIVKETTDVKAG